MLRLFCVLATLTIALGHCWAEGLGTVSAFRAQLSEAGNQRAFTIKLSGYGGLHVAYNFFADFRIRYLDVHGNVVPFADSDLNQANPVYYGDGSTTATLNDGIYTVPVTVPADNDDGETTVWINLDGDLLAEGTERVELVLADGSNYDVTLGSEDRATVFVLDDEPAIEQALITQPVEGTTDGRIRLSYTETLNPAQDVQVALAITPGQAQIGTEYTVNGGSTLLSHILVIPSGSSAADFTIEAAGFDDALVEGQESLIVQVLGRAPLPPPMTIWIADNEPAMSAVTYTDGREPDDAAGTNRSNATLTITLAASQANAEIPLRIGGTAQNGVDYTLTANAVLNNAGDADPATWNIQTAGQQSLVLTLTPQYDGTREGLETAVFTINGKTSRTLSIVDSDQPNASVDTITLQISEPKVREDSDGRASILVRRSYDGSPSSFGAVTVNYTVKGSATEGLDFILIDAAGDPLQGSITLADGQSQAAVFIDPIADTSLESLETVVLMVDQSVAYQRGNPHTAEVRIQEDDIIARMEVHGPLVTSETISSNVANVSRFQITFNDSSTARDLELRFDGLAEQQPDAASAVDYNLYIRDENSEWYLVDDSRWDVQRVSWQVPAGANFVEVAIVAAEIVEGWPSENDPQKHYGTWEAAMSDPELLWAVDATAEGAEDITCTILESDYYVREAVTDTITIEDDDLLVELRAWQDAGEPSQSGAFRVTFNQAVAQDVVVKYQANQTFTIPGTNPALAGIDYQTLPGSLVVQAGSTEGYITVIPIADSDNSEGIETLRLDPVSSINYRIAEVPDESSYIKVVDVLGEVSIQALIPDGVSESQITAQAAFQVNLLRSGASNGALEIAYTAISSDAEAGRDYETLSGVVTIATGATSAIIEVTPINDEFFESTENLTLSLVSGAGYTIADAPASLATIELLDDEPTFSLVADPNNPVADEGAQLLVHARSQRAANIPIELLFAVTGTATIGADYTIGNVQDGVGRILIPQGQTSGTITINLIDDTLVEDDEDLTITLSPVAAPSQYGIIDANDSLTITIADNEPTIAINAVADAYEGGSNGRFRVSTNQVVNRDLNIAYTIGGTVDASDYTLSYTDTNGNPLADGRGNPAAAPFLPANASEVYIDVKAANDGVTEITEQLVITLGTDEGYRLGQSQATIDVVDTATIDILSEPNSVVVPIGGSLTSVVLVSVPSNLAADDVLGQVAMINGTALPAWVTIDATASSLASGEARFNLTLAPDATVSTGNYRLRVTVTGDIDQNDVIDTSGADVFSTQDLIFYIAPQSGNS